MIFRSIFFITFNMKKYTLYSALSAAAAIAVSCSAIVRMDVKELQKHSTLPTIALPADERMYTEAYGKSINRDVDITDTSAIIGPEGRKGYLVRAFRDSSGTLHMSEPLNEVVITARFKNIPERNGTVRLAFEVNVPSSMLNRKWQVRLEPHAVLFDDTLNLEAVHITGDQYRERQIRGYELYNRFLASIITDSSLLIHAGRLEIFINRHIPQIAALKNDTAYIDPDSIRGQYGITRSQAKEHFMKRLVIRYNDRKKRQIEDKFRQFVKDPYTTENIRLDTIMNNYECKFVYLYKENLKTRPKLRKIDICLSGGIYFQGERLYDIPISAPLTFYVSSFSSMTEDITRYVRAVIERKVELTTSAAINFKAGKADIDTSYMDNHAELQYIQSIISDLLSSGEYLADSLIITASCSPEGSFGFNSKLARKRAASIAGFLDGNDFQLIERHIPENWERLYGLLRADCLIDDLSGIIQLCGESSPDRREYLLSTHPEYSYIKEQLYPILREVEFQFCLHRKNMVKDTIHTTEIDTIYSAGVQAIKDRDYGKAVRLLGSYRDINSALAFLAMDYNASAMNILEELPVSGKRDYLLAVVHSRNGNEKKAVEYFLSAVNQERSLRFRGNLDPEISRLIDKYKIQSENL